MCPGRTTVHRSAAIHLHSGVMWPILFRLMQHRIRTMPIELATARHVLLSRLPTSRNAHLRKEILKTSSRTLLSPTGQCCTQGYRTWISSLRRTTIHHPKASHAPCMVERPSLSGLSQLQLQVRSMPCQLSTTVARSRFQLSLFTPRTFRTAYLPKIYTV